MIKTDLRRLLVIDSLVGGQAPLIDKDDDESVFVIDGEGEAIFAISKPKRAYVPIFKCDSQEAVQERIASLLLAVVQNEPAPIANVGCKAAAQELVRDTPDVTAILAPVGCEEILAAEFPELDVYKTPLDVGSVVIGVVDSAGTLFERSSQHFGIGVKSGKVSGVSFTPG